MADFMTYTDTISVSDQNKLLDEALFFVKEQAYYMRKAVDAGALTEALKFGNNVVSELRTSSLSPTHYYELYMKVFNELQYLADFLGYETKKNHSIAELYQTVQQSCFIVPRLYLLIMTGAHYIKSQQVPAKEILNDIIELCKGVQHPMRGLFLRYYLVQICKDKLPDVDSSDLNGIYDAFEFLMTNFKESLRLWIRLNQYCTNVLDQRKRDKERLELGLLVGANLVRISQLEGLDLQFYSKTALPQIIEQLQELQDPVAQKYILDCLVQTFSDEYHLNTLSELLQASIACIKNDDAIGVLTNLMSRLATFITANPESVPSGVDVFELFYRHLSSIEVGETYDVGIGGYLQLQASFLEFTTTLYPAISEHIESILNNVVSVVEEHVKRGGILDLKSCKNVVTLLTAPLRSLSLKCLEYSYNESLIRLLDPEMKRTIAIAMIEALINSKVVIDSAKSLDSFFLHISPLFEFAATATVLKTSEFSECEHHLCRLIDAVTLASDLAQFQVYSLLYDKLSTTKNLYPRALECLLYNCLKLQFRFLQQTPDSDATPVNQNLNRRDLAMQIFHTANTITDVLCKLEPNQWVKILTTCALAADECCCVYNDHLGADSNFSRELERVCASFLNKACVCYEDYVFGSKNELEALCFIMSSMCRLRILTGEDYAIFAVRLAKYGANMLRLNDKGVALEGACHVFNNSLYRDPGRVVWCMQRIIDVMNYEVFPDAQINLNVTQRLQGLLKVFKSIDTTSISLQIEKLANRPAVGNCPAGNV